MAKKKEIKQVEAPIKLAINDFLKLSNDAVSELVEKEVFFFHEDKEYSVDVGIKILSYDEVVNLMRGKDAQKTLMSDLIKSRIAASIFNKETKKPLFSNNDVGKILPSLMDALHKASDEVNDFSGKYLMEKLMKKNSGVNSSSTESVEEQSQKPSEE
ncbi:phage tail assembly chaperone family protein, TAC [Acinetobacter equi]|uniref:Uncharacterized protein n=1 Tax=Acinetobacter equi TaxID=1324350 RepID=A0A0N9VEI5_9GAMM|nr:phage tail assembly chaperone family protein, TAC [Acinetobacter equi]ALH95591.1 hypothetical protein AOY20_08675 [Acinetobacter equi]